MTSKNREEEIDRRKATSNVLCVWIRFFKGEPGIAPHYLLFFPSYSLPPLYFSSCNFLHIWSSSSRFMNFFSGLWMSYSLKGVYYFFPSPTQRNNLANENEYTCIKKGNNRKRMDSALRIKDSRPLHGPYRNLAKLRMWQTIIAEK